ncbi:hypothetical protein SLE2022_313640 [Rubroshorea leprosula]
MERITRVEKMESNWLKLKLGRQAISPRTQALIPITYSIRNLERELRMRFNPFSPPNAYTVLRNVGIRFRITILS